MNEEKQTAREDGRRDAGRLPPMRRWKSWQLVALGAGIFVCGVLVGSFATAGMMHRFMVKGLRNPDQVPVRMVERMRSHLDLTDEQAEKVLAILKGKHETMARTFRETFASAHEEVRELLNEEQAAKWDEKVARMRAHIFGAATPEQGGDAPGRDDR